jgi:hypothetical protein
MELIEKLLGEGSHYQFGMSLGFLCGASLELIGGTVRTKGSGESMDYREIESILDEDETSDLSLDDKGRYWVYYRRNIELFKQRGDELLDYISPPILAEAVYPGKVASLDEWTVFTIGHVGGRKTVRELRDLKDEDKLYEEARKKFED